MCALVSAPTSSIARRGPGKGRHERARAPGQLLGLSSLSTRARRKLCLRNSHSQSAHSQCGCQLRLYVDSADQDDWEEIWSTGMFYGVTTNPILLERAGVACSVESLGACADAAFKLGAHEFQAQTWGGSVDRMVDTGLSLAAACSKDHREKMVIKVPMTKPGLEAASKLIGRGVRVTMTGVYTAHQAISAAAIGAEYAAPYLGRMGLAMGAAAAKEECVRMQRIAEVSGGGMRILVASIKSASDMAELAACGMDTFTFSPTIAGEMTSVEQTLKAAEDFEGAALRMADERASS